MNPEELYREWCNSGKVNVEADYYNAEQMVSLAEFVINKINNNLKTFENGNN